MALSRAALGLVLRTRDFNLTPSVLVAEASNIKGGVWEETYTLK